MDGESSLLSGRRVMIADDEQFSRSIVVRMLEKMGCTDIVAASDGAMARTALADPRHPIDLAILDFRMPHHNGLELLKEIRIGALVTDRALKVVMLTSSSDYGLLGAAMALDVDTFLTKPVTLATLAGRLGKIFVQPGELKTTLKYKAVDIDKIIQRLIKPVAKPASVAAPDAPAGIRIALSSAVAGMVLAENIVGPNKELVLAKGIRLTERLIARLTEVHEILHLDAVFVEP